MLIARPTKGTIPWLFNDTFCHWSDWHVCFNVGLHYNNGALLKQAPWVRKVPAPPGHVSTTVTTLCMGAQIKYHMIPASCLTPAVPKGKSDMCLILKGDRKVLNFAIAHCRLRKQEVVLGNGTTLPFDDVSMQEWCRVVRTPRYPITSSTIWRLCDMMTTWSLEWALLPAVLYNTYLWW